MQLLVRQLVAERKNQTEVADLLGVDQTMISKLLSGQRAPGPGLIETAIEVLGLPCEYFYDRDADEGHYKEYRAPYYEPDLPPRLRAFLQVTPVTDIERGELRKQAARDGLVDFAEALIGLRTPAHKKAPERPTTAVALPENITPRAPRSPGGTSRRR